MADVYANVPKYAGHVTITPEIGPDPGADKSHAQPGHRASEREVSDAVLLQQIAAGDQAAVAEIYDRHCATVFGMAIRVTRDRGLAENVVQETFVSIWRSAPRFDMTRATARTWIVAIAHHRAVDAVRGRRAPTVSLERQPQVAGSARSDVDVWREVSAGVDAACVARALGALPAAQRQALEMAYFDGLTQNEIAAATGAPAGTVKGRVRLGLLRLRQLLAADFEQEFAV